VNAREKLEGPATRADGSDVADGDLSGELLRMIEQVTGHGERHDGGHGAGNSDGLRLSEDLYLDSLGRVQLQTALEQRLGVELEDDALASATTLGELQALVDEAAGLRLAPSGAVPASEAVVAKDDAQDAARRDNEEGSHLYPRWPWSWPVRWVRIAFLEAVLRPMVWLLAAPTVKRGSGKLPDGPLLVIANHVTAYDGALVLYALPARLRRRMAIAMSGEMLLDFRRGRNQGNVVLNLLAPAAYWLLTALFNVYPLPRQRGFRKSFAHAGEAMDLGYGVLIFPEGTRSRNGALQPFRPGIGLLAAELHTPVVPVALMGLGALREEHARWFRSGRLEVRVGEVIPVEEELDAVARTARFEASLRQLSERGQ
jgi:long-chain acyl-CoA synthetase